MKFINKLVNNLPGYGEKEENLSTIFKPLNDIEQKVTNRQEIIKGKILELTDKKTIVETLIKDYETEFKRCEQYLNNINKFT